MTVGRLSTLALLGAAALAACGGGETPADEAPAETPSATQAPPGEMIVVSGASGQLGGLVVDDLLAMGVPASRLILVSRTPQALQRYADMGASARFGDFSQPESLPAAYAGGQKMLLISINTSVGAGRAELHKAGIDAAKAAGVQHIVYTSLVDLDNNDSPLGADHKLTEQYIRDSGLTYTMLRNALYMNGLIDQAIAMLVNGSVQSSNQGAAYVTREDCAAAAAAVLATGGHENQVYDITGPAVIYPQDVGRALAEETEMSIRVVDGSGAPAGGMLSSPSFSVVSDAVMRLTGRAPMSIAQLFAAHHDDLMAGTGA
jgi:NAD(P)H dehydrogenase (quinone)